jgi:hypothetical protein
MSKNMKIKYKKNTTKNNTENSSIKRFTLLPQIITPFNPLSKMLANFIDIIAV